jgi:hypothetical protein
MVLFADRVFQVWSYTVGVGRLALRSPKSSGVVTRVDLLFQNVKALKLPTRLEGLSVRAQTDGELSAIEAAAGFLEDGHTQIFVVEGTNYTGYLVAGVVVAREDTGEYDDPSVLMGGA